MTDILDLTQVARRAHRACRHLGGNAYVTQKNGIERCELCGDKFPCASDCAHVDCELRRGELGLPSRVKLGFPHTVRVTEQRGPLEVVLFDTTDDDPTEWVLP